ncbi:MAG TPA: Ig domain-containing protein, partial [Thermoanaerobaculia bacterium]
GNGAPSVTGGSADAITANSATLHATVNPNGLPTTVSFDYGSGSPPLFVSTPPQNIGNGQVFVPFSANIGSLTCGTTYTYYANATNSAGTTPGPRETFDTSPCGSNLTIVTTSLPDAPPNQPYSTQLAASGGTGAGYIWSLEDGSLPAGLTLNALTGVISGTPTQASTLSQFTIGVRDSGSNSTIRRFSLYVLPASGLTILSNGPSNYVFYVGTPYTISNSLTYLATGGQAPYSWTATGLPPGLQIDAAGGFLYGTPTQTGSSQAEITATDATGETGSLSTVITVGKTAIIITDSSGHTPPSPPPAQVGTSYQFFFNAAGGSQSGYTWSISQGNLPPGLTAQNGPGCPTYCSLEVTGTPTLAGTYTFTVAVNDSLNDHGSQVATIVVNSGTPPSIATTQLPTATIGASYSAALSATGGTPPYRWSFVGSAPDPGIQISQDGTLTGITQNTNDCPTGSSDHLGGIWVGAGYPSTYFQVIVTDAAGQSSAKQLCLVSYYPRPQVSSDSPPSITIDGQNHTITLNGGNFRSTSYIVTNGGATLPTTYIGPNALSFTLYPNYPGPLCANQNGTTCFDAGSPLAQSVIEPYSNISLSSVNLAIYNPPPTLTSVAAVLNNTNQPCTANQLCQLVVTGGGFSFHGDTNFLIAETNTIVTAVSYPSGPPPWTQIITSAFSLPSGTYTLQVTNTHQAGGTDVTVSATFHVN